MKLLRAMSYGYANARIRSKRSRMLSDKELLRYCKYGFNEVLAHLLDKGYPQFTEFSKDDLSYPAIEAAIRKTMVEDFESVYRMSPASIKPFMHACLNRWNIQNVVTALRARSNSFPRDSLKNLILPTRTFNKSLVTKLRDASDTEEVKRVLSKTMFGPVMEQHWQQISEGNLRPFEEELDKLFFKNLKKHAKDEYSKKYAKLLIDNANIKSVLRKDKDIMIPGGTQDPMKHPKYKSILSLADDFEKERQLDVLLKKYGEQLFKEDPLSSAPIVGYLITKGLEARNVRIILRLKDAGLQSDAITPMLVRGEV